MKKKYRVNGFTLIEVMVVVVILGILAAIVVPKIMSRPDQAKVVKAKQDILAIESALMLYKLDNGIYPTTEQGLQALVSPPTKEPLPAAWKTGGYLKELPLDPWDHSYHYVNPGQHSEIDIFSYGAGGQNHTAQKNTEIGNWSSHREAAPPKP